MRPYAFVLAVSDLDRSVRYFVDVLSFRPEWRDGDNWQCLVPGQVRMMLRRCPDAPRPAPSPIKAISPISMSMMWTPCTRSLWRRAKSFCIAPRTGLGGGGRWRSRHRTALE